MNSTFILQHLTFPHVSTLFHTHLTRHVFIRNPLQTSRRRLYPRTPRVKRELFATHSGKEQPILWIQNSNQTTLSTPDISCEAHLRIQELLGCMQRNSFFREKFPKGGKGVHFSHYLQVSRWHKGDSAITIIIQILSYGKAKILDKTNNKKSQKQSTSQKSQKTRQKKSKRSPKKSTSKSNSKKSKRLKTKVNHSKKSKTTKAKT